MSKYAIKHEDGMLVGGISKHFVNFAGDFSKAMTFSSKRAAQETAELLNSITVANGAQKPFYSVCERSGYRKPNYLKKSRKR